MLCLMIKFQYGNNRQSYKCTNLRYLYQTIIYQIEVILVFTENDHFQNLHCVMQNYSMKSVCLLKTVVLRYGRNIGGIHGGVDLGWRKVDQGKMMYCLQKRYYNEVLCCHHSTHCVASSFKCFHQGATITSAQSHVSRNSVFFVFVASISPIEPHPLYAEFQYTDVIVKDL